MKWGKLNDLFRNGGYLNLVFYVRQNRKYYHRRVQTFNTTFYIQTKA